MDFSGSSDSGGMFGGSLFGGGGSAGQSKEFGSSSATSTIAGDSYGLQFDQRTIMALGISLAVSALGIVITLLILRK